MDSAVRSRYHNPDNDPRGPYVLADVTAPFDRATLRYEWHGQFPPAGRSWRYSKKRAETFEAEGRIVLTARGLPSLKRYLSEANSPQAPKPPVSSKLELIVRNAMKALVIAIAENPEYLHDVEWRDLERILREVFETMGFDTKLTRSGKDGGFDLQLQCDESGKQKTFLVEVKHWMGSGKKVGKDTSSGRCCRPCSYRHYRTVALVIRLYERCRAGADGDRTTHSANWRHQ